MYPCVGLFSVLRDVKADTSDIPDTPCCLQVVIPCIRPRAVNVYGPKEASDFALEQAGNIDMSRKGLGQVHRGYIVLVKLANKYGKI